MKHITIIEDDAVMRRGLRLVLSEENFEVATFPDVTGVFEYFTEKTPDIILCDYKLPSSNGIEVLKEIRKLNSSIPFFLMTGYYKETLAVLAKEEGASEIFEKPLDIKKLINACRSATGQRCEGERPGQRSDLR